MDKTTTYTKKILAHIGKQLLLSQPVLAEQIVSRIPVPLCTDITRIDDYFEMYCKSEGIAMVALRGPVYKWDVSEQKKVFVAAMHRVYYSLNGFNRETSRVLGQKPQATSRMIGEVEVRYRCDKTFKEKVDNIINYIKPQP